jgi:hypothetical protein
MASPSSFERLERICRRTVVSIRNTTFNGFILKVSLASKIPSTIPERDSGSVLRRMDFIMLFAFIICKNIK